MSSLTPFTPDPIYTDVESDPIYTADVESDPIYTDVESDPIYRMSSLTPFTLTAVSASMIVRKVLKTVFDSDTGKAIP